MYLKIQKNSKAKIATSISKSLATYAKIPSIQAASSQL
jgi:hypothetical protein